MAVHSLFYLLHSGRAYSLFICCTAAVYELKHHMHSGRAYSHLICCKAAVHIDSAIKASDNTPHYGLVSLSVQ